MHRIMTLAVSVMLLAMMVSCSQDVAEPLDPGPLVPELDRTEAVTVTIDYSDPGLEFALEVFANGEPTELEKIRLRELSAPVLTIEIDGELIAVWEPGIRRQAQGLDEFPLDCYSILPPHLWGTTMPTFDLYILFAGQWTDDAIGWGNLYSCPVYLIFYEVIYDIDQGTRMFVDYLAFIAEQGGYPPGSYPWCCDVPNDLDRDCPGLREASKTCE